MSTSQRRPIALTLGTVAAGLLAASFLSMAVASADDFILVPDPTTFDPTQAAGDPPYSPEVVMGSESWSEFDLTTSKVTFPDGLHGVDTQTVSGTLTNDDFASNNGIITDLTNFGGGWENEWYDNLDNPGQPVIADLAVTPFGNFELFGPPDIFTTP
ncbi:MAG: hypothetical protein WCC28_23660 [Mycobacterium sp.]|uniref:hypothetical protein n=1 Tax=Mycobacterium sp. TaxID=1785 RepID=UPI003C740452